jgi:hypothetical protein
MKTPAVFLWIVLALLGGCATKPPPANVEQVSTASSTGSLNTLQCWSMGCSTVEAPNCPAVAQDFSSRQLACKCSNGSSCITERNPR